jgi:hypothetical protein
VCERKQKGKAKAKSRLQTERERKGKRKGKKQTQPKEFGTLAIKLFQLKFKTVPQNQTPKSQTIVDGIGIQTAAVIPNFSPKQ